MTATLAEELNALVKRVPDLSAPSATKFRELEQTMAARLGLTPKGVQFTYVLNPGSFHNRLGQGGPGGPATRVVFALLGEAEDIDKHTRLALVQASQRVDRVIVLCALSQGRWAPERIVGAPSSIRTIVERALPNIPIQAPARDQEAPVVAEPPDVGCFHGFADDAFQFLADLERNNNKEWFHANDSRFLTHVKAPMRCLIQALGPAMLRIDPGLETTPMSPATISRIVRQNPGTIGPFNRHYWAAFFRKSQGRKQDDVQLDVGLGPRGLHHGLYFGEGAPVRPMLRRFRELVAGQPGKVREILVAARLANREFCGPSSEPQEKVVHDVTTDAGLKAWADEPFPRVNHFHAREDPILRDPGGLIAHVIEDFQELWPLFVMCTSLEDPIAAAQAALHAESPVGEVEEEEEAPITWDELRRLTCMDEDSLQRIRRALDRKRQIVLSGPPGTGKTYVALTFAEWFTESRDRVELVQFHPSYSYEDFIEGIRAQTIEVAEGRRELDYDVVDGIFKRICDDARRSGPNRKFVLVIDEINRGQVARIFGELLFLLEYRDREARLTYRPKTKFSIPENVYLIGTMNTADRSIALVDFALRRRFSFIEMAPSEDVLTCWLDNQHVGLREPILKLYRRVNQDIDKADYRIGHTHFMQKHTAQSLEDLWRLDLKPYLAEYFFPNAESKLLPIEKDVREILTDAAKTERPPAGPGN